MRKAALTLLLVTVMLLLPGAGSTLIAQVTGCGTDRALDQLRKDSSFRVLEKKMNDKILLTRINRSQIRVNAPTPLPDIVLPVVVHIVGTNPASLTDAQVADIIKDLNEAFSKTGNYAISQGANTHIQFQLAQKDPDGGITNGITRTTSPFDTHMNTPLEDHLLKNLNYWDPDKYINIWYISSIDNEITADFSCGVWQRGKEGGHASMPVSSAGKGYLDGIVVTGPGALLAHEMGHYLGLYHTFEGFCSNNNCATDGDRVCDTPPDGSRGASNCSSPSNSCNTDTLSNHSNGFFTTDVADPVRNFMDYNGCPSEFTQGQADRMQDAITAFRSGLLNNGVLTKPCTDNISALFTRDNADPVFNTTVNFTSNATGAVSYQWSVDNVPQGVAANFSYAFPTAGNNPKPKYKVTLKVFGPTPGCFASSTDYVLPNCGLTARFYNNKTQIAAKAGFLLDTILFTNTSVDHLGPAGTSYRWVVNYNNTGAPGNVVSNVPGAGANDLNYSFDAPGTYAVKLIASNGGCIDSTLNLFLFVLDPTPDLVVYPQFVRCFQETKLRLQFSICNNGYAAVKPGVPVSFYDSDPTKSRAKQIGSTFTTTDSILGYCCKSYTITLDAGRKKLDTLYAVVNDAGGAIPIALPNNNTYIEKTYTNNISSTNNFRFRVNPNPALVTLEPGDTYPLSATTFPDFIPNNSYTWSSAYNLSCSACQTTQLTADTTQTKRVIAVSSDQCFDTAYVEIKVPPADDYTVTINSFTCAGKDSLLVNFKISNGFKRGIIPKDLRVAFYVADSFNLPSVLIPPVFVVPSTTNAMQQTFSTKIKKPLPGNIIAVVNDTAIALPVSLPNTSFLEKNYNNNTYFIPYQPIGSVIDTTICTGDTLYGYYATGIYTTLLTTAAGCDSLRILKLRVRPETVTRTTVTISICQGDVYEGYNQSGTYTDVFKGVNACDSIRTLQLTVNPTKKQTRDVTICKGESYLAGGTLQTTSGIYQDVLKTSLGCDSIIVTNLYVSPFPVHFLPNDSVACIGKTVEIALSYPTVNWSTGSIGSSISINQPGAYSAQVIDKNGCKGGDTINVSFKYCITIQIPDAFTPNNDAKNDVFKPLIGAPITNYRLQIWNRWGQLLFETREYTKGWNGNYGGRPEPAGTYVYLITFTDMNGATVIKKGTLVLIR